MAAPILDIEFENYDFCFYCNTRKLRIVNTYYARLQQCFFPGRGGMKKDELTIFNVRYSNGRFSNIGGQYNFSSVFSCRLEYLELFIASYR